ncbi:MAG: hypothetical protein C0600_07470 [Ignavibacteria bacterium]|nr:MAG: hypothetical protein C0600_07470 [Ignavibacteria bacterium]
MKVMVVDDNANMRAFLREQLLRKNMEVVEYVNGWQAVDAYLLESPDVVLMDIVMPGMDGLEATERIRDLDRDACIYIVTDYGDEEFRGKALALGARGFFIKEHVTELLHEIRIVGSRRNHLRHP